VRSPGGALTEIADGDALVGRTEILAVRTGSQGTLAAAVRSRRPKARARFERLSTQADPFSAAVAGNRQGFAAVAWTEGAEDFGGGRIRLAVRRPGGGFARPVTVARVEGGEVIGPLEIALGPRGHLVVAYVRGSGAVTHVGRRAGRLGPATSLGPAREFGSIAPAIDRDGRVVVAWQTQDGGEEAGLRPVVRAAVRRPGRRAFGASQRLDPGTARARPSGPVRAELLPDGTALVVWGSPNRSELETAGAVRAATAGRTGRFGAPQTLATDAGEPRLATGRGGEALVAWVAVPRDSDELDADEILAAQRPAAGGPFGRPEVVSAGEGAVNPAFAFDPVSGRPLAVWGAPAGGERERLRFAERMP